MRINALDQITLQKIIDLLSTCELSGIDKQKLADVISTAKRLKNLDQEQSQAFIAQFRRQGIKNFIHLQIRQPLLQIYRNNTHNNKELLYYQVSREIFLSLIITSLYWPLNQTVANENDPEIQPNPICPITNRIIGKQPRLVLLSGHIFDKRAYLETQNLDLDGYNFSPLPHPTDNKNLEPAEINLNFHEQRIKHLNRFISLYKNESRGKYFKFRYFNEPHEFLSMLSSSLFFLVFCGLAILTLSTIISALPVVLGTIAAFSILPISLALGIGCTLGIEYLVNKINDYRANTDYKSKVEQTKEDIFFHNCDNTYYYRVLRSLFVARTEKYNTILLALMGAFVNQLAAPEAAPEIPINRQASTDQINQALRNAPQNRVQAQRWPQASRESINRNNNNGNEQVTYIYLPPEQPNTPPPSYQSSSAPIAIESAPVVVTEEVAVNNLRLRS